MAKKSLTDVSHPANPNFNPDLIKENEHITHSAEHMNGHLLCSIDCETSGLNPFKNDLIQLAVLPLTPDYAPSKIFRPFVALLKPKRPDNIDPDLPPKMRQLFLNACTNGMDPWTCVDRFEEWFQNLHLPQRKKIIPLGHNYGTFDMPFISEWLGGPLNYDAFFRSDFRDTIQATLFINDACDAHNVKIPLPKYNMTYLCSLLNIEHPCPHDAVADAFVTAKIYKKLLRYYDHFKTIGSVTLEQGKDRNLNAKE